MKKTRLITLLFQKRSVVLKIYTVLLASSFIFNLTILNAQSCSCVEYLYVNDISSGEVHKHVIDPADGNLNVHIGDPWYGPITNPHGLGSNLNGDLFIGGRDDPRQIHKIKCDGTFVEYTISGDDFPDLDYNSFVSEDNVLYVNGRGDFWVEAFDLCSGDFLGTIDLDGSYNWELIKGSDGLMYTLDERTDSLKIYQIPYDRNLYSDPPTTVIPPAITTNLGFPGARYTGLAQDELGFWYAGVWPDFSNNGNNPSRIYKLNPDGSIVSFIEDPAFDGEGFMGSRGFAYSPESKKLYIATRDEDCIAVVDAGTMTYQPELSLPGGGGKAIKIIKECCPSPELTDFDLMICQKDVGEKVFINNVFNCNDEGIICEGEWEEIFSSGFNYNSCEISLEVTSSNACGEYRLTKGNDATGYQQCDAYELTLNVCIGSVEATISQSECIPDSNGDYFIVTVDGSTTNPNISGQYEVVLNAEDDGSGGLVLGVSNYGTPIEVGNGINGTLGLFAADGASFYPITVRDINAKTRCNLVLNTTLVEGCEEIVCSILGTLGEVNCIDSGTPNNSTDDVFSVFVNASTTGIGAQFTVSAESNVYGPFDYTLGGLIENLPADGTVINLLFSDSEDPVCQFSTTVSQVACSIPNPCSINSAGESNLSCQDNGTDTDPTDDFLNIDLNPTGSMNADNYLVSVSSGLITPSFGSFGAQTTFTISEDLTFVADIVITIIDEDDSNCTYQLILTDPSACSIPPIECNDPELELCAGSEESYTLQVENGVTNVQWYLDGISIDPADGGNNTSIVVLLPGSYHYTGEGIDGCAGELCCPIVIREVDCCDSVNCLTGTISKN